jgi:hypothetical protein
MCTQTTGTKLHHHLTLSGNWLPNAHHGSTHALIHHIAFGRSPVSSRSQALLPLFNASSGYLHDKISSSVLASLAAGLPLLVPQRFLQVYEAFKEEHVLLLVRAC